MLVLVIIDTVLVVLLTGLVAGLLRSHTEILRVLGSTRAPQPPASGEDPPSDSENSAQLKEESHAQQVPQAQQVQIRR